jgi:hypothetical protein
MGTEESHALVGRPGEAGLMSASRMTLLVLASIGVSLALHYFRTVEYPASEHRLELHRKMIEHDAPSQLRHRILAPFAAEGIARVLALAEPGPVRWRAEDSGSARPLLAAYFALNAVAFSTALVALYLLLQSWYPIPWALAGALLAGAAIPLTFGDHYYHPDSPLELAFFAVGLLLMVRRRLGWLGLVVVFAALNRETSLFLVLAILWAMWNDRAGRAAAFGYLVTWAAIFLGLRVGFGFPPPTFTLAMAWEGNRAHWLESAALNAVFLGAFWFCVARGLRQAPDAIARAAIVLPPYVALLLVIGYWWEIRYWLSMLPILIPLGLASLTPVVPDGSRSGKQS